MIGIFRIFQNKIKSAMPGSFTSHMESFTTISELYKADEHGIRTKKYHEHLSVKSYHIDVDTGQSSPSHGIQLSTQLFSVKSTKASRPLCQ